MSIIRKAGQISVLLACYTLLKERDKHGHDPHENSASVYGSHHPDLPKPRVNSMLKANRNRLVDIYIETNLLSTLFHDCFLSTLQ